MSLNIFFKRKNISTRKIFSKNNLKRNFIIQSVKPLHTALKNDLSFFDSIKYKLNASKTKTGVCITTEKLKYLLPPQVQAIVVKNVLFELARVLKIIYPKALIN